jgi:hypothetical protein
VPGPATRARATTAVVAGAAFVLLAVALASPRVTREMPDFEVYWRAAVRAAAAEPLYRAEDQHYQFKYLPAFAVLAAPLGLLPLQQAKIFWFGLSVALLLALVASSLHLPAERRKPRWLLAAAVVLAMGKFYGHELVLGQVNLLFGVIAVGSLLWLKHGRDVPAGLLIALAVVVKPYAALFVPWLLAQRRPRAFAAAAAGVTAALALPALVYGVPGTVALHGQWWRTVFESTAPNLLNQDNVSLAAMFAKWMGPGPAAAWLAAAAAVTLLFIAGLALAQRGKVACPEGLEGALLLTLIPLLTPQGWDYVFLIATPAVVYLGNYEDRLPRALRVAAVGAVAVIGLSLFDLMGRANYARFMSLSIITLCFLVVIAALAVLRARGVA